MQMSTVVGVRSLAGVESRVCEGCQQNLNAEAFYCKNGRINSTLCKQCTCSDNKLRRENPAEHQRVKEARIAARADEKAKLAASVVSKQCTRCGVKKPMQEFREHRGLYGRSSWCRECERQYTRDWTEDNRDEFNERRRETWAETERTEEEKAAAAERARDWYAENKERAAETQKVYYKDHKSEIVARATKWVKDNPDRHREFRKKWHVENGHIRRHAVEDGDLTVEQWEQTLEYFNRTCAYCLRNDVKLTMDHVVALSRGGRHTRDNIVPACGPCNSKKRDNPVFVMAGKVFPTKG